jgi:hypothetical protein
MGVSAGIVLILAMAGLSAGADFTGDGKDDIAIFRPSTGMWAIQGQPRVYLGQGGDVPLAYELPGSTVARPTIFRPGSGLFAVHDQTRVYLGQEGDIPIGEGYGPNPGPYDYIVKPNDAADLVAALESGTYRSVFVPNGTYYVNQLITVDNVRLIVGESKRSTVIQFMGNNYMLVNEDYCQIENIQFEHEDSNPFAGPLVWINAGTEWAVVQNCRFDGSSNAMYGLQYSSTSNWIQVLNCYAVNCDIGFLGSVDAQGPVFSNCQANACGMGFAGCENLSSCEVVGNSSLDIGFSGCRRLVSCKTQAVGSGFDSCLYLSACTADGQTWGSDAGYRGCSYISSCAVSNATWGFQTCTHISSSAALVCTSSWVNCNNRDSESTTP